MTSTLKLVRFPPLPDVPDSVRGRALVAVTLAFTGSEAAGNDLVSPLRQVAPAYLDLLGVVPAPALAEIAGDPPGPLPGLDGGGLLDSFGPDQAAAYVELAGPESQSALVYLELRHLGGALRRPAADPGRAGAIEARPSSTASACRSRRRPPTRSTPTCKRSTSGWDRGAAPPEPAHLRGAPPRPRASFPPDVADRLAAIVAARDPDGVFVANHTVD